MLLTEKYADKISAVLTCYDRIIIQGVIPGWCFSEGMTSYFYANDIRIFDYANFSKSLSDKTRENAEPLAKENGIQIEFIRKLKAFRKEDRIQEIIRETGKTEGLVHIFSAMECCNTYKPWHDKETGRTYLKPDQSKCLHYYFYFLDKDLGLCYLRVPTWCPFRLQFYMNGHNLLAKKLDKHGIVLRIESTCNDVGSFRVVREVHHKDGTSTMEKASMKKSIYSLYQLFTILKAANYRYLEFISSFDDHSSGGRHLKEITSPVIENNRSYRGINFFCESDLSVLEVIGRGEFMTYGMQNKDIRKYIPTIKVPAMSRILKRLSLHGLIERKDGSYKYFPTALGKAVISAGLSIRNMVLVPQLAID